GRILDQESHKVVVDMKTRVKGRYGTGQCDGWKNITKTSLVASMINVEYMPYLLNAVDISAQVKNAENLLEIVVNEISYCVEMLGTVVVAWCTDSSGESVKMRRLLRQRIPSIVTVACWAHQLNLVVADYLKVKQPFIAVVDTAVEVIKWFNNHGRALGLLKEEMRLRFNGKVYSLILPVITRWTSHYVSCQRLLLVEKAIRALTLYKRPDLEGCAGDRADAKAKAKEIVKITESAWFWDNLRQVKKHLKPLAIAVNATQANHARLDVVLLTLGHLYHLFLDPGYDDEIFLLALVLNPYIRRSVFRLHNPAITEATLWNILSRRYKEMFGDEPELAMSEAFTDYLHYMSEFSAEAMCLRQQEQMAEKAGTDVNLVTLWRRLDCGLTNGRNGIVVMAMRILSIVPNSAATERIFSAFGIVHTDIRNRLDPERVRKTVLVKGSLDQQYPPA
ncbi:hypothetical protein CERSUDRAFT_29916, partial [Gelatoporia subvermispora B]